MEITIKMKTIGPKTLNDKNHQASSRNFDNKHLKKAGGLYRPKRCGNNNKDEDNSLETLNDKNHQASSRNFDNKHLKKAGGLYRPKRCGNNNKDEDNSLETLNDKNHQASSRNFDNKHQKEAGGYIDQNVMEKTMKMKTIVWKHLM